MDCDKILERTPGTSALIDKETDEEYKVFLARKGIDHPTLHRIKSGRNSRVWRVENSWGQWILKEYHRHSDETRDRLDTEFGFLRFLWEKEICNIPEPMIYSFEQNLALYSLLPGKPLVRISSRHIDQVVDFVVRINRLKKAPGATKLPAASEACFCLSEHLSQVKVRLKELEQMDELSTAHCQARELVKKSLMPAFQKVREAIQTRFSTTIDHALEQTERILSPSDLGFHNILQDKGRLQFLDFEYAGWDDPAKLICDFACQPERPIRPAQAQQFGEKISESLDLPGAMARAQVLLLLYRLKWCCIFLNEFHKKVWQRREHAGRDSSSMLRLQMEKTRNYFNQHLKGI